MILTSLNDLINSSNELKGIKEYYLANLFDFLLITSPDIVAVKYPIMSILWNETFCS